MLAVCHLTFHILLVIHIKFEMSRKKVCGQCGIAWQSTTAGLKELGIGGRVAGFYNQEKLIGDLCSMCQEFFQETLANVNSFFSSRLKVSVLRWTHEFVIGLLI